MILTIPGTHDSRWTVGDSIEVDGKLWWVLSVSEHAVELIDEPPLSDGRTLVARIIGAVW